MEMKTFPITVKDGHVYAAVTLRDVVEKTDVSDLPILSEIKRMYEENDKLRELCAGLWDVMWACAEQRCPHRYEDCFVVSGNGGGPKGHGECWYKRRMRELEVEVD